MGIGPPDRRRGERGGDRPGGSARRGNGSLPRWSRVLAVCAHPDDESFGLGAILSTLSSASTTVSVLCLTHGEASTLGAGGHDLRQVREAESTAAAAVLGVTAAELRDHPDGGLADLPAGQLAAEVHQAAQRSRAEALLVFDEGGITGHPDHRAATAAAMAAAQRDDLTVLAWTIPRHVAATLNTELATTFVGRPGAEVDLTLTVDRAAQLEAIACHHSQSAHNPTLWRRLQLLGDVEHLRYLRRRRERPGRSHRPIRGAR